MMKEKRKSIRLNGQKKKRRGKLPRGKKKEGGDLLVLYQKQLGRYGGDLRGKEFAIEQRKGGGSVGKAGGCRSI